MTEHDKAQDESDLSKIRDDLASKFNWSGVVNRLRTSRTAFKSGFDAAVKHLALNNTSDVDSKLAAKDQEILKLKKLINRFKPWGSEICRGCDSGSIILFAANAACMDCNPKSYEPASAEDDT